jgi:hypothetical protein
MNKEERIVLAIAGFCIFTWLFGVDKVQPDKTQCDIPTNSAELIAQVATVKQSLTVEKHIADATKMAMDSPKKTQEKQYVSETDFVNHSSPSDKPAKPEVLVFVSKSCPPCEKWKRCEMQRFLDAGWSVGIIEVHRYPITPRYEINANGKQVDHVGYLTFEQAKELAK